MHIIDSHFHYWPRAFFDHLCKRRGYPRVEPNERGGFTYWRQEGKEPTFNWGPVWFDVDNLLDRMQEDGHEVDVISSIGPISVHFSDVPPEAGRDDAMLWNEEIAAAQRKHPGRFFGIGAIPLTDGRIAVEVLDHAVRKLGLFGVNIPSSVGNGGRIDHEGLEPFYDRIEELGAVLFLHPTDTLLNDLLQGYDGALYLSLGRVMDVSVAAARLIFSGLMERHPKMKIYMSHTGGVLPYVSGRLDKTTPAAGVGSFSKGVELPHPPSTYIKRMYTDIVQPNAEAMKFALGYFGVDHIIYGTDYPCWNPTIALRLFNEIGLSEETQRKIFHDNAKRFFALPDPVQSKVTKPDFALT
jgi:aminocarboxymuconate-semialdehyde decarboxylase